MKKNIVIALVGVVGCACVVGAAQGQTTFTQLNNGWPFNMSGDGSVVVGSLGSANLVKWSGSPTLIGPWTQNGTPDVSGDGTIVAATIPDGAGNEYAGYHVGGAWTVITDTLGGQSGTSVTSSYGISDDGSTIVGLGWINAGTAHAFSWTKAGGMVDIGGTRASGVNGDGSVIVGFQNHPQFGFRRLARWVNGTMINDKPDDVGEYYSCSADGQTCVGVFGNEGYIRQSDGTFVNVGVLPGTPFNGRCDLLDVSDDGRIAVGINSDGFGPFAAATPVAWTKCGGLINLHTFLTSKGVTIPGTLDPRGAWAITGEGTKILVHVKQGLPTDLMFMIETNELLCYADCDDSCDLSIDDFICFQTFFALGDAYADCDGDGALSIDDFICFQTFFAIGC